MSGRGFRAIHLVATACAVLLLAAACDVVPTYPDSGVVGPNDAVGSPLSMRPPTDCDTLVDEMRADARARYVPVATTTTTTTTTPQWQTFTTWGTTPASSATTSTTTSTTEWATTTQPTTTQPPAPVSTLVVSLGDVNGSVTNGPVSTPEFGVELFEGAGEAGLPRNVVVEGDRLYVVRWGVLRAFDVSTPTPREIGALDISHIVGADRWEATLLLRDGAIFVFGRSPRYGAQRQHTAIASVALDGRGVPTVVTAELRIDGSSPVVAAVRDDIAFLVLNHQPVIPGPYDTRVSDVVDSLTLDDFLSSYTLRRSGQLQSGLTVPCESIDRPARGGSSAVSAVVGIELTPSLSAPAGRAFPILPGVGGPWVRAVDNNTLEVAGFPAAPASLTPDEEYRYYDDQPAIVRSFELNSAPRMTDMRLEGDVTRSCDECDGSYTFDLGDGRTASVRQVRSGDRNQVSLAISEVVRDGVDRTVSARFDGYIPYSIDGPTVRWDSSARRLFIENSDYGVLTVDVDDPLLRDVTIEEVSRGMCSASFVTAAEGETLWLVDDAVRSFTRSDMTELGRYDFPDPSSFWGHLPVCD